jgi:putative transposase
MRRWRSSKNFPHKTTACLTRDHKTIVTEALIVKNITVTAKGTEEAPSKHGEQKAGLSPTILDATPGLFTTMLAYKAEKAGYALIILNTRKYKPRQTDPLSENALKNTLSHCTHTLADSRVIGRDEAAPLVILRIGLK